MIPYAERAQVFACCNHSPSRPSEASSSLISPAAWELPWRRASSMPRRRASRASAMREFHQLLGGHEEGGNVWGGVTLQCT